MNRIEDIVYYDFQGWPEYKMNLREVLIALHFMPDFSMNQITTIIRPPLLMAATTDALGGWNSNVIIKVLMTLDFTDGTHIHFVLATLINKQAVAEIIQTFFFYRMLQGEGMGWRDMQVVDGARIQWKY